MSHIDILTKLGQIDLRVDGLFDAAMRHDRRHRRREETRAHAIEDYERIASLLDEVEELVKELRGEHLARIVLRATDVDISDDGIDRNVEEVTNVGRFENGRVVRAKMLPDGSWADGAVWGGSEIGWTTDYDLPDDDDDDDVAPVIDLFDETLARFVKSSIERHPSNTTSTEA